MKFAVGDILFYPLTATVPGWLYDYALISDIKGDQYVMDSCDRNGNVSPVSLTTWVSAAMVDDPVNGYERMT